MGLERISIGDVTCLNIDLENLIPFGDGIIKGTFFNFGSPSEIVIKYPGGERQVSPLSGSMRKLSRQAFLENANYALEKEGFYLVNAHFVNNRPFFSNTLSGELYKEKEGDSVNDESKTNK